MRKSSRTFQIFVKPVGAVCNLDCRYCYYLEKEHLYSGDGSFRMPDDILEEYIIRHIEASPDPEIRFSWHGGEPTVLGLDFFQKIVAFQRQHRPPNQRIINGIQTNGTLLNEDWCRFFTEEGFYVGISLDGPEELHDMHRVKKDGKPTHAQTMRGYELLRQNGVHCDILCVVHADTARRPAEVYRFFKQIDAQYVSFLPLVTLQPETKGGVSPLTVPSETWGAFLCAIFDEWIANDIGRIKVQIFEEAARTAFGQEHSLCIFRPTCGDIPVIEHNGDFYSCDHFVDAEHCLGNIRETPLIELLESPVQQAFGRAKLDTLPRCCLACKVRTMCNGECPKNRFIRTPDGEAGLNYLCAGYKRFFTHCADFVAEVGAQWRWQVPGQHLSSAHTAGPRTGNNPGRNEPCPCGSGKKYKKC